MDNLLSEQSHAISSFLMNYYVFAFIVPQQAYKYFNGLFVVLGLNIDSVKYFDIIYLSPLWSMEVSPYGKLEILTRANVSCIYIHFMTPGYWDGWTIGYKE